MRLSFSFRPSLTIYFIATIVSILLSTFISAKTSVINTDGICYLQSAEAFNQMTIAEVMHLCGQASWPFYSLLIFIFGKILPLSYETIAFMVNGFFSLLMVLTFISIVGFLGGNKRVLIFAAAVILFAHELNSVKQYIIRDHGFWAFYLLSILSLLYYFRTPRFIFALAWSGSLILATLFRLEGLFFLMFIPWVVWFKTEDTFGQRFRHFFELNAVLLLAIIILWITHPTLEWGRLHEFSDQIHLGTKKILFHFQKSSAAFTQYVLPPDSAHNASFLWGCVLFLWYCADVVGNLSWIFAVLVVYALWQRIPRFSHSATLIISAYILGNVVITSLFFLEHLFISKRYLIAFSILWMLWVPFALDNLLQRWHIRIYRQLFTLSIISMAALALSGIFDFGYSKAYIRQSGDWLAHNIPAQAKVYSNDYLVMYYSKQFGQEIFTRVIEYKNKDILSPALWQDYDYLALRIHDNNKKQIATMVEKMHLTPIQVFANKRGDQVQIYKR